MDFTAENAEVAEKRENQMSAIILDTAICGPYNTGTGVAGENLSGACLTYELN